MGVQYAPGYKGGFYGQSGYGQRPTFGRGPSAVNGGFPEGGMQANKQQVPSGGQSQAYGHGQFQGDLGKGQGLAKSAVLVRRNQGVIGVHKGQKDHGSAGSGQKLAIKNYQLPVGPAKPGNIGYQIKRLPNTLKKRNFMNFNEEDNSQFQINGSRDFQKCTRLSLFILLI